MVQCMHNADENVQRILFIAFLKYAVESFLIPYFIARVADRTTFFALTETHHEIFFIHNIVRLHCTQLH